MREELLYYLWKHRRFKSGTLTCTGGQELVILDPGSQNSKAGPDFFNARIVIGNQDWAGNVEIHIHSSDWYAHGHERDIKYDNVILHVVWNHDVEVFRKDNSPIPVFELKAFMIPETLEHYKKLHEYRIGKWINCETHFGKFDDFVVENWLERLYLERLEEKTEQVFKMLEQTANNWEAVLFLMLARSFGLNQNSEAFLAMATSVSFSVVQKASLKRGALEALFFGQAGMLAGKPMEPYFEYLRDNYHLMQQKFDLKPSLLPVHYFRLRPDNFPTIRLAQLAKLYEQRHNLFSEVIVARSRKDLQALFRVGVSEFWQQHYTFLKSHPNRKKVLSQGFIDLLIINTLIPLKYCLARYKGEEAGEEVLDLIASLKAESNNTVRQFNVLRPGTARNALQSQALLRLKQDYCDWNKCLSCSLGATFLKNKV